MSVSVEREPARTDTSPPVRLAKGEIPQTWSRPAEQVSQLPIRASRPLASALIVISGSVVGFALALWLAPARRAATPAPPATTHAEPAPVASAAVAPAAAAVIAPKPVSAIPTPPPTSFTRPGDLAPEDQGGDLPAPSAPALAPPSAPAPAGTAAAPPNDDAAETPARAKARRQTSRAKALFDSGELIGAEAPLIRATLGDPSYAEAWRLLGAVREQLGKTDSAKRAYQRYLQLAPEAADARQVRAALAALARAAAPADGTAAAPTQP